MTTVVSALSAGNTKMSMSLLRFWRANRSCLVMLGEGGLERILVTCLQILSAYSDGNH